MVGQAKIGGMYRGGDGQLYTTLNNGVEMPLVQFGTYAGASTKDELETVMEEAVRVGYRAFDTAECYGTEENVGRALNKVIKEGLVKREELFVTTKLWNDHHAAADVEPTLRASLERLGLDYVDLYLIHWPVTTGTNARPGPTIQPPLEETWKAMEEIYKKGLARAIGVSNYSVKKSKDLLQYGSTVPAVNQVECHPTWRDDELVTFNKQHGIHTSAWGPLGSQMPDISRPMDRPQVQEIAKRLGKTPAQVVLRWGLQHGTSVLPKTGTLPRLKENFGVADWELAEDDYATLSALEPQRRQFPLEGDPDCAEWFHPEGPYKHEADLWDE